MTLNELTQSHPDFVASIKNDQINANAGWKTPPTDLVDRKIFECQTCKSPGMNTCWGVVSYVCGASIDPDGEIDEPCPHERAEKE